MMVGYGGPVGQRAPIPRPIGTIEIEYNSRAELWVWQQNQDIDPIGICSLLILKQFLSINNVTDELSS